MTTRTIFRRRLAASTALCAAAFAATPALAQAVGGFGTIASRVGGPTTTHNGSTNTLEVAAPDNAILNWTTFNVPDGHTANYRHTSGPNGGKIAILNRVVAGGPQTNISGNLNSDPNVAVYVINPNGVLFGSTARVNVGSLVASTQGLTDADFIDGDDQLNFTGASDSAISVAGGAQINAGANGGTGDALFLSGGSLDIAGQVTAAGDLGLIVAKDITAKRTAGSPLSYQINSGTIIPGTALTINGTLTASSLAIGLLSNASSKILMDTNSRLVATGATSTDYGVEIFGSGGNGAYRNGTSYIRTQETSASAVAIQSAASSSISSARGLELIGGLDVVLPKLEVVGGTFMIADRLLTGGTISSTYDVYIQAGSLNVGQIDAGGKLDLLVSGEALLGATSSKSNMNIVAGSIALGRSGSVTRIMSDGSMLVRSRAGDIEGLGTLSLISKAGGMFLESAKDITFDAASNVVTGVGIYFDGLHLKTGPGSNIKLGSVSTAQLIGVGRGDGFDGNIEIGKVQIAGLAGGIPGILQIQAAQNVVIGEAIGLTGIDISSGRDIVIGKATINNAGQGSHDISLSSARAIYVTGDVSTYNGSILLDSRMIEAKDISGSKTVTINAWDGNASTGNLSGDTITLTTAGTGNLTTGNVNASGNFSVAGTGAFSGGAVTAGGDATIAATNVSLAGDMTAATILLNGQNVTAQNLTSTGGNTVVQAYNGNATVKNISATGSAAINTGGTGNVTVTDVTTGGDFGIGATGVARVDGNVKVGNDYGVTAATVHLGVDADAETQAALGKVTITSTSDAIRGGAGLKLTSGGATRTEGQSPITLKSASSIAFDATSEIKGGEDFRWQPVRLESNAGNSIQLGKVTSLSLSGLKTRQNDVILGDLSTVIGVDISTTGSVHTGLITAGQNVVSISAGRNITIGGANTASSVLTLSAAGTLTSSGDISAFSMLLDGASVSAKNITATSGNAVVQAYNGNATIQNISATGNVTVTTGGTGNVTVNDVTARGTVGIAATGAGRINGNVSAVGNVLFSGKSLAAQDIYSSIGTVGIYADYGIGVRDVSAAADVVIATNVPSDGYDFRVRNVQAGNNVALATQGSNLMIDGDIQAGVNVTVAAGLGKVIMADDASITANEAKGRIQVDMISGSLGSLRARDVLLSAPTSSLVNLLGDITAATLDLQGGGYAQKGGNGIITVGKLTGNDVGFVGFTNSNIISEIGNLSSDRFIAVTSKGNLSVSGAVASGTEDVEIHTDSVLTLAAGSSIAGADIGLMGTRFINNAGATAVNASNQWEIVTDTPEGNVYGGLDSGNTANWGEDSFYARTGNRYSFRYQPTLIFTSTDISKTYGDDISTLLAGRYTVSGLHQGIAGAFLGDTLAEVVSGDPVLSSLGATVRASVAGGPYVMEIGPGSLVSEAGYKFAFNNAGRVTVGKKALTGTVAVNDKTYDGSTTGTGRFASLDGLVGDDSVGADGKFTFASRNAGTHKVTVEEVSLTGADAGNYTVTVSVPDQLTATILKKAVTVQLAADDKTYDGTATGTGRVTGIDGRIAGDDLTASGGSYAFGDKNAGSDKIVTISGIQIGGADAGNYEVTIPVSVLADILKKSLLVSAVIDDKTYDGTTAATGRLTGLDGKVGNDDVNVTGGSFKFADKNAGKNKAVTLSGFGLSGADAGNYELTLLPSAVAEIFKKALTATAVADNKIYDGTTTASGRVTGVSGAVSGDDIAISGARFAFGDKNAGQRKTVLVSDIRLSGQDAGNYTIAVPSQVLADVFRKAATVNVAVADKTYDGTTGAVGGITGIDGALAGDDLTASGGSFAFADKNAAAAKLVTISGIQIGGADARNYDVTIPASALAAILKKTVNLSVVVNGKTYDGITAASGKVSGINGVLSGDVVTASGGTFTFIDKNAGAGKSVTIGGITIGGPDAGNYDVVIPATALADILKKAVSITIAVDNKTYDGTTTASGRITGLDGVVAGDDLSVSGGAYAFADKNAGQQKAVSATGFTMSGDDSINYVASVVPGASADVAKRAVTIRANDTMSLFGRPTGLTYSFEQGSLAPGDSVSGALSREPGIAPGSYAIGLGTLALSANYDLTFIPGTFTVQVGALPAYATSPSLYQTIELGGRAEVLKRERAPLLWTSSFACPEKDSVMGSCRGVE